MTKEKILEFLLGASDYLSGEEMSRRLGVSRAAVWKAVRQLKAEGYEIRSVSNRGYLLASLPDALTQAGVFRALGGADDCVTVLPAVDSTNNCAKTLAAAGAADGTFVISDCQTAGRGRRGRSFCSPAGCGVYASAILRPAVRPEKLFPLTAMLAVAACDAVEETCAVRPRIKWTNDLVLGGKKIAGILTELSVTAESGDVDYAVCGVGINCLTEAADFPADVREIAGSIFSVSGKRVDRCALAAALVRRIRPLTAALAGGDGAWLSRYRADCLTIGREVQLIGTNGRRAAFCEDVAEDGALLVRLPDGTRERVFCGEVSVRGLYGYI